jgi:release factor glutamine methyltransferase
VNVTNFTVAEALSVAKQMGVERLDAQILLAHLLACPRSWLLAHDDMALPIEVEIEVRAGLARRAGGEPLAYIVGQKEFYGLMLRVNANVLVPRPDTEVLVDWAIRLLTHEWSEVSTPRVVDLGTGSGAIALAVKQACPKACVLATDVSAAALSVAHLNAQQLGLTVQIRNSMWWDGLSDCQFELALSNPPYIAEGDSHLTALSHEPTLALTSGVDGMQALRLIIDASFNHLVAGGWLLLEHGYNQADYVRNLLRKCGFSTIETCCDLSGQLRITGGKRPLLNG